MARNDDAVAASRARKDGSFCPSDVQTIKSGGTRPSGLASEVDSAARLRMPLMRSTLETEVSSCCEGSLGFFHMTCVSPTLLCCQTVTFMKDVLVCFWSRAVSVFRKCIHIEATFKVGKKTH
jgi:hypothetical protein